MVIKLLCGYALTGVAAVILGMLYTGFTEKRKDTLALNLVSGTLIFWAVFQLISVPCIFLKMSFTEVSYIVGTAIIMLCVLSLILNRKRILSSVRDEVQYLKGSPMILVAALLILILQVYMYVRYMHQDADDAFYVATAVTADQTDTMYRIDAYTGDAYKNFPMRYVLSPFPIFVAFIARVFQIHPAIMAHTVLPVFLMIIGFCVLYLLGNILFPDNRKKAGYFIVFCQIMQLFSGFNVYQQGMFFLVRIWQGKAVLAGILLPFCFYMGKRLFAREVKTADWFLLSMLMLSCCMVSSMGIMLGAVCMGILGILGAIDKKSVKILVLSAICCIPNVIYALVYILR